MIIPEEKCSEGEITPSHPQEMATLNITTPNQSNKAVNNVVETGYNSSDQWALHLSTLPKKAVTVREIIDEPTTIEQVYFCHNNIQQHSLTITCTYRNQNLKRTKKMIFSVQIPQA